MCPVSVSYTHLLKNAVRDGAEWAWVPHGDTCPFCITLASNGWQKASRKVLKGGHAEHIHANCDCAVSYTHLLQRYFAGNGLGHPGNGA